MAKYEVNHSCGHSETHQLYGPGKQREWRIGKMEGELCTDCAHVAREEANQAAAAKVKADYPDLPNLDGGTPTQLSWAGAIRAKALPFIFQVIGDHAENTAFVAFGKRILKTTSAKYWIDRRSSFESRFWVENYIECRLKEETAAAKGRELLME